MSQTSVDENVKDLINSIIARNGLAFNSSVEYNTGAEVGVGYLSKTLTVRICDGKDAKRILNLFLKCMLNVLGGELPLDKLFDAEIHFYEAIYPAFINLLEERGVEDGFRNAPKCYGTNKKVIALEDLKKKGYSVFERTKTMDDNHITMLMKTYAKFHAVSFAFKDQKTEEHKELLGDLFNFGYTEDLSSFEKAVLNTVSTFLTKLDPVRDKHIFDACKKIEDSVSPIIRSLTKPNESAIVTHGDSWCNNMMFLYEEGKNKANPIDMMIIDWQMTHASSPVFDLTYAFYTVASKEALNELVHYLKIYHEELSKQIRQLGSDPDILYPYSTLEKEWKQHAKFGFTMSFTFIKLMLSTTDETHDFEDIGEVDLNHISYLHQDFKNEEQYLIRMRDLTEHMIKSDFI